MEHLVQVVEQSGLITGTQAKDVLARSKNHASRVKSGHSGASRSVRDDAGFPTEILSSFKLEINGGQGAILTEDVIAETLARSCGLPYVKIDPLKLDLPVVTGHIPHQFALKNLLVTVGETGGLITVAVADPYDESPVQELGVARRLNIRRVVSSKTDILKIIREFYGFRASIVAAETENASAVDLGNLEHFFKLKGQQELDGTDRHVVSAVDFLLNYSFEQHASDIHIEPKRENTHIRFRIDGILHNIHTIPKPLHAPIVSRIKMLSRMDLAEKRRPQDGRIKTNHNNKDIELRVSTIPVAFGEKVVIRIFDPDIFLQDLDAMGFYPRELSLYRSFLKRPNGIILVTGPTGSGKTTTLYSSLRSLASSEVNIITVEDPIEMVLDDFNQIGVQQGIGIGFDTLLRNILRQDPDIIMIGEIRDRATAENAVQAALTGHLVLSTLHTNDSVSTIIRLMDLGIPPFMISATLVGVVAQRLIRTLCPHCKCPLVLDKNQCDSVQLPNENLNVWGGHGCKECRGTGYKGRSGLFEVLEITEKMKALISGNAGLAELLEAARQEGMVTLRESAMKKMREGMTTYEEVVAMTG